jgi:mono/diheme cytochrome c family protein
METSMERVVLALIATTMSAVVSAQTVETHPVAPSRRGLVRSASLEHGSAMARQVCGECHAIERGRTTSPNPEAPAFQVIADTPGMSNVALRAFLYTPHRKMPNIVLSRDEADDIIEYIRSLAGR